MDSKATELKEKIRERQDILNWLAKEQRFPLSAYNSLAKELRDWRIELAVLENVIQELEYKMIKSN
jgi:hypothetical protein